VTEDEIATATQELLDEGLVETVPDLDDIEALAARWLDLEAERERIVDRQDEIKAALRKLPLGTYGTSRGDVTVSKPTARFDPEQAARIVPAETLQDMTVQTIDRRLAQAILPPALYRACQSTPAGAVPVVRIR
jgi:hypothetical protein